MTLPDVWASLEDAMIGDEPDYTEPPPPIPATDLDQANRRLVQLARIEREVANVYLVARAQIDQVIAWRDRELTRLAGQADWVTSALEAFHRAVLADDPKRSTIGLPAGTLSVRRPPATWDCDDVEVIGYAHAHGHTDVVRVKPDELDRNAMKARYTMKDPTGRKVLARGVDPETGERVPGITIVDGEPTFTAKPRTGDED